MIAPPAALAGDVSLRPAAPADTAALERLIALSARALGQGFYSDAESEAAITHVYGVDTDLVADGTFFVATVPGGSVVGCGGWSQRRTLFGGDRYARRVDGLLDPATDAARIRAFFVAPEVARRGVATLLLSACETAAIARGFTRATLMATLSGVPFYAAHGYVARPAIGLPCGELEVEFVPMDKVL